jgi:hypothetical protein
MELPGCGINMPMASFGFGPNFGIASTGMAGGG